MGNLAKIVIAIIVVAAAAFGLVELEIPQDLAGGSGADRGNIPAATTKTLESLEVASPGSMAGYSREKFPHWSDADEFGWTGLPDTSCDVRDAALIRGREGCRRMRRALREVARPLRGRYVFRPLEDRYRPRRAAGECLAFRGVLLGRGTARALRQRPGRGPLSRGRGEPLERVQGTRGLETTPPELVVRLCYPLDRY